MDKLEELSIAFQTEFDKLFAQCKNNKKFTFESKTKQNWYYTYLKYRLLNRLWNKYKFDVFDAIIPVCYQKIITMLNQLTDKFVDIKDIEIGHKE